jgi:hypothetical protein
MGISQGYGKISGTDALVFAYDTGDTRNSYVGEPTANLINPNAPSIYSWWNRSIQTIETLSETYQGQPIYRVTLSLDTDEQRGYANSRWGAGTGWYMPYIVYNANTAYTASVIYRPVSHSDLRVYGHPSNISGWGLTVDDSIQLDGGWFKHRIDRNFSSTVGDNRFHHMHAPTATTGQAIVVDITHSQIEQKSRATSFVNGTRSNTQGLLDLTGRRTINLSTVSFNTGSQIVFDGTDDTLDTGIPLTDFPALSNFTIECIVKIDAYPTVAPANGYGSTTRAGVLVGATYYSGTALYWYGNSSGNACNIYSYIRGADGYRTAGEFNMTPGKYHHLVLVNNNGNSTLYLYADGIENGSEAGPTQQYNSGLTGSAGNIGICKAQVDGGGESVYSNLQADVPVVKLYNRALSATEVAANYRHYKSRFSL